MPVAFLFCFPVVLRISTHVNSIYFPGHEVTITYHHHHHRSIAITAESLFGFLNNGQDTVQREPIWGIRRTFSATHCRHVTTLVFWSLYANLLPSRIPYLCSDSPRIVSDYRRISRIPLALECAHGATAYCTALRVVMAALHHYFWSYNVRFAHQNHKLSGMKEPSYKTPIDATHHGECLILSCTVCNNTSCHFIIIKLKVPCSICGNILNNSTALSFAIFHGHLLGFFGLFACHVYLYPAAGLVVTPAIIVCGHVVQVHTKCILINICSK